MTRFPGLTPNIKMSLSHQLEDVCPSDVESDIVDLVNSQFRQCDEILKRKSEHIQKDFSCLRAAVCTTRANLPSQWEFQLRNANPNFRISSSI